MKKFTSQQIFDNWVGYVRENLDIRYSHKDRPEVIGELVSLFNNGGVKYEEALSYTKQVVQKLTTVEGRKGKGRYKGWKETVEEDYRSSLAREYVVIDNSKSERRKSRKYSESLNNDKTIPADKWIEIWLNHKFGNEYPNEIKDLAHTVGSVLNIQFMKDVFESDWVKQDHKVPQEFRGLCER